MENGGHELQDRDDSERSSAGGVCCWLYGWNYTGHNFVTVPPIKNPFGNIVVIQGMPEAFPVAFHLMQPHVRVAYWFVESQSLASSYCRGMFLASIGISSCPGAARLAG